VISNPKAIIHLDRLCANYELIKKKLPDKQIMSVVKANAYGHGSVECALALEKSGCKSFAVFTIDEGIELRNAGVQSEILVFSRMDIHRLSDAVINNLILNICDKSDLLEIDNYINNGGISPIFHLKVDTGMTRLGIDYNDVFETIKKLKKYPQINCEGIYSHFSTADEGDLSYALNQLEKFNAILKLADEMGVSFKAIHFSNSGALLNLNQKRMTHVRVGMMLYGAYPSNEVPQELIINPVMEFKASIVQVRRALSGTKVSYGGVYKTESDTNIGVIQCGFADGLPRPWYKGGVVSFEGRSFEIAGRICMDQFMVNFEEVEPTIGDEVLLFGSNGNEKIKMETIANHIDSTPYVISTSIGGRTNRIFKD
jgi:alanine racemase